MLEGRGVNQTDTWVKTPGCRLVHFSGMPTTRPSGLGDRSYTLDFESEPNSLDL